MMGYRSLMVLAAAVISSLLVLLQGACSADVASKKGLPLPPSLRAPFIKTLSTVYPGSLDETNRFLPAVSINTPAKQQDGEDCSGVLISPRVVLTAGHCVCLKREIGAEDRKKIQAAVARAVASQPREVKDALGSQILEAAESIIDGSACAPLSTVTVIRYPPTPVEPAGSSAPLVRYMSEQYQGLIIRPHDDFMIVYRGKESIFKEADLAMVVLSRPVEDYTPAVKLASAPVRTGEQIVMVGHGYGSTSRGAKTFGNRHFAESVVVGVHGSDAPDVQFDVREEPPDGGLPASVYPGDSGGPCFSKSNDTVLVGIATGVTQEKGPEKRSVFTSVYPHREWVKRVVREVGESLP